MAHQVEVADEQFVLKPEFRKTLFIVLFVGIAVFGLGLVLAMFGGHEEPAAGGHASVATQELVATAQHGEAASDGHAEAAGGHHEAPLLYKRIITTLWMNNIYFVGFGIIGLFFVAIQFAAQAGWSAGLIRVPLAMGYWIPLAGILTLVLFLTDYLTHGSLFHWTHHDLYVEGPSKDEIISGKAAYFYWPLEGGSFPIFFLVRMVLFFGLWYLFFARIKNTMLAEDLDAGNTAYWYKSRSLSTWFLLFFAVSSSVASWDWVMSIDTHWFSTMFGWYMFASWWVSGLAMIILIVAYLKSAGYLKVVNANHLHDLGKFVFAFSIFWTYIWFSQFMLIYYANIPEETTYFLERMDNSPYSWIFYVNLIMNFLLPFLLFMTRDSKRHLATLKLICPLVIVGHWFDFYNMVTPGIMQHDGGIGLIEIGTGVIFMAVYLLVVLTSLAKLPLIGKNHPMLQESLHHHI
jgi:hypothetical protein